MNYKELISYDDKVNLYSNSNIPAENKVQDTDMNNIKNVVNGVINGTNVMGNIVVDSIRSKNIFGNYVILNGVFINSASNTLGSNSNATSVYIPIKPNTTYTVSKTKGNRFAIGFTNTTPEVNVALTGIFDDRTAPSLTSTSASDSKYLVIYISLSDTETFENIVATIQAEEGDTATIYSPYQNLDAGSVLVWQNSNIGSEFIAQDVNISNLNAFTYYEIIYKQSATQNYMQSSGKIPIGQNCCLGGGILRTGAAPRFWARFVTYGTNKLTFSAGYYETTSDNSASTANDIIIPYQILLYK